MCRTADEAQEDL
jgi:hypothetical protein